MREYTLKPLTRAEQLYAYKQSQQIAGQTGYYGYLHGDFDKSDNFNNVFEYYNGAVVREHFDEERNNVIDFLEDNICSSPRKMRDFCYSHKEAAIKGKFGEEYGFRIDAGNQTFIIRLNPFTKGDYNCYMLAYDKHLLDRHMKKAAKGINFIYPNYSLKFNLEDGDHIVVRYADGTDMVQDCRYIDQYHFQIGNLTFHICQYAELLERNGATVIPYRDSLPDKCYVYVDTRDIYAIVTKGKDGYEPFEQAKYPDKERNREYVAKLNKELGVTDKQVGAMTMAAMFGWADKDADPRNFNGGNTHNRNRDDYER